MRKEEKSFGDMLFCYRTARNIRLEELGQGLCAPSMIAYIEKGSVSSGALLRIRILERLGVDSDDYESFLGLEDYNEWKLQQQIYREIAESKLKEAIDDIAQYDRLFLRKRDDNVIERLRKQFYYTVLAEVYAQTDELPIKVCNLYYEALNFTIPNLDEEGIEEKVLSLQELNLYLEYHYWRYCITEEKEAFVTACDTILSYLTECKLDDCFRVKLYAKVVYYACRELCQETNVIVLKRVRSLCNSGIEMLRNNARLYYLQELLRMRKDAIQMLLDIEKQGVAYEEMEKELFETEEFLSAFTYVWDLLEEERTLKPDYYLFCGQDTFYIGDIIRRRRKMMGMSRHELCEGICSLDTVRRLENGQRNTQTVIVKELCGRLNLPTECERTELAISEVRAHEMERKIRYKMIAKEHEEVLWLLGDLEKRIDMTDALNRQWIIRKKSAAEFSIGLIDKDTFIEKTEKALMSTLTVDTYEKIICGARNELQLTNSEMECFFMMSLVWYPELLERAYAFIAPIEKILAEYEVNHTELNHIRIYELYMHYFAQLYRNMGYIEKSKAVSKKLIIQCFNIGRGNVLMAFFYEYLCALRQNTNLQANEKARMEWRKGVNACRFISKFCKLKFAEDFFRNVPV